MRPDKEAVWLDVASIIATRSTCARRRVGAVLVDWMGRVLSTGYNGTASGLAHCIDHPCGGANLPSGTGLDRCEAIHAEANALLQCPHDTQLIHTCYITASPCIHCVKLLMNTGCLNIIFLEDYPGSEACAELWLRKPGRQWIKHEA